MRDGIVADTLALMRIPGLSGHEGRVRRAVAGRLAALGLAHRTDRAGNLIATLAGDPAAPAVMVHAHMDQLGFLVRRIEADGLIRLERLGGIPERVLAAADLLVCVGEGADIPAVVGVKSHHATPAEEKARIVALAEAAADTGHASRAAVEAAGVRIGTPAVWRPFAEALAGGRIVGTAADDRAGCAVLLALARALAGRAGGPTVHLVWTVQEEFNLRGAMLAARALRPDAAIQLDLMLATDTPDLADRGDMRLGGGPGISLYNFHGRGTLNGLIPHPALVALAEAAAAAAGLPLQRQALTGVLTDNAYVQLEGAGVAAIDLGFPCRYTHSPRELCDAADLEGLARLVLAMLARIGPDAAFDRDMP